MRRNTVERWAHGSFRLDIDRPDHLTHFSVSSAISFLKSAGGPQHGRALIIKMLLYHGIGEGRINLHVEPVYNLGWRISGTLMPHDVVAS